MSNIPKSWDIYQPLLISKKASLISCFFYVGQAEAGPGWVRKIREGRARVEPRNWNLDEFRKRAGKSEKVHDMFTISKNQISG